MRRCGIGLAAIAAVVPALAWAAGTPAGTVIENVAEVSFRLYGVETRFASPAARFAVAELVEATLVAAAPVQAIAPGDSPQVVAFRLVNLGNGPEAFRLELEPAAPGSTVAPVPRSPALYMDSDGSGTWTPADLPYPAGVGPELPPDAALGLFAVLDVPADAVDAARARVTLTARAATGTGAPGTSFAGAGVGGVDAVLGLGGGAVPTSAELVVAGATLALAKSAVVADAEGGARPEPGARITWQIDVAVSGRGVVRGVVLRDPVPPSTRFVPGSLELDGVAQSDAEDADAAAYAATPPRVEVRLGDLPAGATRRVRFAVTID